MTTDLIIGIDGGGSKTLALLADADGNILGRGSAGRSNYHAVGREAALEALDTAVKAAFAAAALRPQRVHAIGVGLAGVDRPDDRAVFEPWVAARAATGRIVNDARLVLAAGTPDDWGVAVIAGTGSIVIGRDSAGREDRSGGWGYLLGDEGSGFAIGMSAVRAAVRAADGRGPQTQLLSKIMAQWSLASAQGLIAQVYQTPPPIQAIAALLPLVEDAAQQGDAVAQLIFAEAGRELALTVQVVVQRLALPQPTPCALAGGGVLHSPLLAQALHAAIKTLGVQLGPIGLVAEPAQGALRLARAQIGR